MKELVGKKILALWISDDESILAFDTDSERIAYQTYGDCCSETWFADIVGVAALIGGTVTAAEEVLMDGYVIDEERNRQDEDQAYGWKLTTDKGYCDIVYRNSSNGYYGGNIDLMNRPVECEMVSIDKDWSA